MARKRDSNRDVPVAGVNWLEQLAAEVCTPMAPEGWYPMYEICKRLDRNHQYVRRILKMKNAEVKQFMHMLECGRTVILPHYNLNF